jgi:preprotein translocase subunit SecF
MIIVTNRKIFFGIAALLVVGSILAGFVYGLHFGLDFTGGSLLEVSYPKGRPTLEETKARLSSINDLKLGDYTLRPAGEAGYVLRSRDLTPAEKTTVENALALGDASSIHEERFNSVGPTVGAGLKQKSFIAIGLVILCIVLFVTFAFRKVSEPVASWKYGLATIVALAHDVIIPAGIYIVFSHFTGAEMDLLFVTALLAILGYSVHDTIVVFDRVREHLRLNSEYRVKEPFEKTVGESVRQTMGRSINTSLTIFLVLLALYFVGSETTRNFAFILLVGVIAGTYSSIFIASPLLVTLEKLQSKKK